MISLFVLLTFAAIAASSGCNYGMPRFSAWRPLWAQRQQIQRFDPYPDNDIGPPMEGVRPPDFQEQVTEPRRSRWSEQPIFGG